MGLGIFIARTLLAHHGATLEFSNDVAGGAVVEIRWPRGSLEVAPPAGWPAAPLAAPGAQPATGDAPARGGVLNRETKKA